MQIRDLAGETFFFPEAVAPKSDISARHVFMMLTARQEMQRRGSLKILDIGSGTGVSTLVWAEALLRYAPQGTVRNSAILCVDPWAVDAAYGVFRHNTELAARKWGVRIEHLRGKSEDGLDCLRGGWFDIVFIDGSHHHADVAADILSAKRLVFEGGIICGNDLELQWSEVDQGYTRAHSRHDAITHPGSGKTYHPGVTQAVGEAFGPVHAYGGYWLTRKSGLAFEQAPITSGEFFVPSFIGPAEARRFQEEVLPKFTGQGAR